METVTNRIARKVNEQTAERGSLESVRTPWPARRDRLSRLLPAYSHSHEGEGNAGTACELLSHRQGRRFRRTNVSARDDANRAFTLL